MENTNNYWEEHFDELPTFLQIITARLKSHFELSLIPGILNDSLENLYTKAELVEIADLFNELDAKLSNEQGNYRELN